MTKYPIDGLWLTENELALYFLGQLEIESHRGARQTQRYDVLPLPPIDAPKRKPEPSPVKKHIDDQGLRI